MLLFGDEGELARRLVGGQDIDSARFDRVLLHLADGALMLVTRMVMAEAKKGGAQRGDDQQRDAGTIPRTAGGHRCRDSSLETPTPAHSAR